MTHPKTINKAVWWRLVSLGALIIVLLFVSACDRLERAPEFLDYTPTALPPTPRPTLAPSPEEVVDPNQLILDEIMSVFPASTLSGGINWRRDTSGENRGVREIPLVEYGFRITYTGTSDAEAEISVAVFKSPGDALDYFDDSSKRSLHADSVPDDNFPSPNKFGGGTYSSDAILLIDEIYFIEVKVLRFSSSMENPLRPLTRSTIGFVKSGFARHENNKRLEAILSAIPDEISAGETTWKRRLSYSPEIIEDNEALEDGLAVRMLYDEQNGSEATLTYYMFDAPEAMTAHYEVLIQTQRDVNLQLDLSQGAEVENLPRPNLMVNSTLQSEILIIQVGETHIVEIELLPFTDSEVDSELLVPFAEEAIESLEYGITFYDEFGVTTDTTAVEESGD